MVEQLQSSRTGAFSAQGRRMTMEDAHVLIEDFVEKGWIYGGIFDGHGGSVAARYGADHLHHDLARALERGIEIEQAFSRAYQEVARRLENERSGSTAATFLVTDHEVVSANVGDARTILVREKELVQLSTDHRLDIPEEKDRISRSGGSVQYPYACSKGSCIMPTRTLGDRLVRDIGIISSPFIKTQSRSAEDTMLVAACDGLFDFMDNEEVALFCREFRDPEHLVRALAREILETRRGTDNLTILAVSLQGSGT